MVGEYNSVEVFGMILSNNMSMVPFIYKNVKFVIIILKI